ncbi:hypothetical protein SAMN05444678_10371 [Sphingomonas sp. YR710]|uniref:hypothetical protein n=1 Tax=Sphingomonas sp. YR710 TaxID=1882773 RepID=UPI00088E28C2|nr:hypothetical protein [Sphingomonas sp. YR710]SDC44528.1 hypothetical protein SAMN05444678_10371 [Sphingomonas sp. YR710]
MMAVALAGATGAAPPAPPPDAAPGSVMPPPPTLSSPPALDDADLLLVEVVLDRLTLTDSLSCYTRPDGLLIPVGELSRLLDVDLSVLPAERRITGNIGEARRPVLIDAATATIRIGGKAEPLAPRDMVVGVTDIFVRAALLEKILPVRATFEESALRLTLEAREPLPIQSRLDRLGKLRSLQPDGSATQQEVLRTATPYRLFTPPNFDIGLDTAGGSLSPRSAYRYDVRAAGDLLFSGFQGFVGSDDKGRPTSTRATFERRDPTGRLLGPLGLTRLSAGDVFTPTLAIGPRSFNGRGVAFSSVPLTQASVFGRVDLRGELPIGYDVELYVNDVLRNGQTTPVQGRYEFLDVPLVRGVNVIRIVSYGPRGERSEEVRVISVGGGQVAKGAFVIEGGAVQQQRPLIDLRPGDMSDITGPGAGDIRMVANIAYGLSEAVTVTGGAASYSPTGFGQRHMGTLGLRTSLLGFVTQVDGARDDKAGSGIALAVAGKVFGLSTVARHSEYRHGFVDETIPTGGDGRALTRYSELDLDLTLKPWKSFALPLSLRAARNQFANGDADLSGLARASFPIGGAYVSTGLDYQHSSLASGTSTEALSGVLAASSFAAFRWQLRASLDYSLLPTAQLRGASITADRDLGARAAVRLALGKSFTDTRDVTAQVGAILRLPLGDLSLNGSYTTPRNDWRVGLQFGFSLAWDPLGHGYRMTRTGAASGGNLALQAFVDDNNNGRFDPGERPVAGVTLDGGRNRIATDARGRALVTGLGDAPSARLQTGIDDVDLTNVSTPPSIIEFAPRPGRTTIVPYPLAPQGEVMIHISVRQADGKLVGLSALRLIATPDHGAPVEAQTEYDGSVVLEGLRSGHYRIDLDPVQAARLKMRLEAPMAVTVAHDGGVLPDVSGVIIFESAAP